MEVSKSGPSWKSPECNPAGSAPIEESFRRDAGHALASLACALRDLDRAEDAVQEAYVAALQSWPRDGIPANPAAWIVTTARNRAIDRVRREQRATVKHEYLEFGSRRSQGILEIDGDVEQSHDRLAEQHAGAERCETDPENAAMRVRRNDD